MFILVCWTLFFSDKEEAQVNKKSKIAFLVLGILTLFIYRSLSFYQYLMNPDEGMILTAALNILEDGKLWVSADSTTLGPISYLLVAWVCRVVRLIGINCDVTYFLGRFIATMLIIGTFCFLYKVCLKNLSLKLSRVVCLFFIFLFYFFYYHDYQQYNTEFVFVFLITIIIYLAYKIRTNMNCRLILPTGFLCGLLPYVKLQTIPMVFVCIVWILYIIWDISRTDGCNQAIRLTIKRSVVFFVGIFLPTILLVIYCSTYEHGLSNAYFYYIKNAIAHVGPISLSESYNVFHFFAFEDWFNSLFKIIVLSIALLVLIRPKWNSNWLFSFLLMLSSLFAVLRTAYPYHHYMIFLSIPALFFLITSLQIISCNGTSHSGFLVKVGSFLKQENRLSIFLIIAWLFLFNGFVGNVEKQTKSINLEGNNKRFSGISRFIMQQTAPDDYILVWGWEMKIYIYTNRRSATAQSNIERIWGEKYRDYPHENVDHFIDDIKTNQPKLIVDVVTPGSYFFVEEKYALENHTEVWNAIKADYKLRYIYPVEGGSYKIYIRKE
jgi:hypothetical protein